MQPRYADTIERICTWAQQTDEIEGAIIIGSQARNELQADQWSDLDLMLLVHSPDVFLNGNQWADRFGNVVCVVDEVTLLTFTSWDWCVKRILFDDNRDVDFSILPYDRVDEVLAVEQDIIAKGYEVIYDARAPFLESKIGALMTTTTEFPTQPPTEDELRNTVNDLLYHIIWAFKKVLRQELWVAVNTINRHINGLLLQLIEWHTASISAEPPTITYKGRFLEMRTDREIVSRLRHCFTTYDQAYAIETLDHLIEFTYFIAQELYDSNGYALDPEQFAMIRNLYRTMKEHG